MDKNKLNSGIKLYRNLGLIFKLAKQDPKASDEWGELISKVIPLKEKFNKLDNIFVSNDYKRILLVTNKRLMAYDSSRLNKKIDEINIKIGIHNAPLIIKPTLKEKIVGLFR